MTDHKIKKVAITGPESTGKSELAKQLAHHYQGDFVSEFARKYIEQLDREYSYEDILVIAQNQFKREQQMLQHAKRYFFADTELIVTKIWSLHKYGTCHPWIEKQIVNNTYDLILLCNVDLPWQFDEQREHPNLRNFFFDWYEKELDAYGFPYRIVSGKGTERLANAIAAIDNFFSHDE
ncbi:MAG: AAA family ATPase [Bacteroidales bacterium]